MKCSIEKSIKKVISAIVTAGILLSSFSLNASATQQTTPSRIEFDNIKAEIEFLAENNEYASFETVVFCGQDILYTGYFGYADKENQIIADENTVYEWGSVSKTLVWVSAMQLYEQGKLELDRDIRDYLPEGFFKKLKYDDAITMLDLMNHQGGWQESVYTVQVNNEEDIMLLGEALQYSEPTQVFRPGKVTSYSNWGTALAGYVVECVSGMEYAEYVHNNIFEPLGMKHTSVSPDYKDNMWVREQREKLKSYQIIEQNGNSLVQSLDTNMWYINLYPAGGVTGTIGDMAIFAQALVDNDTPLFEKKDTLDLLFSGSSFYGDTDEIRFCHGFWTTQYAIETIGHNGATNSCTANFVFDRESKVGVVVMSNQLSESVFCTEIPKLIFGNIEENPVVAEQEITVRNDISGMYVQTRGVFKGMLKLMSCLSFLPISEISEDEYLAVGMFEIQRIGSDFYLLDQAGTISIVGATQDINGNTVLQIGAMDVIQDETIYLQLCMLILYVLMMVVGLILLIIKLIRKLIKKNQSHTGSKMITISQCARIISMVAIFVMISLYSANMGLTHIQGILLSMLQLVCLLAYVVTVAYCTRIMLSKDDNKAKPVKYILGISSNVFSVVFVLVFELCCFWI